MIIQLKIPFPVDMFQKVRECYKLSDIMKLEKENEQLRNSNRTHKGNYTKLKNSIQNGTGI